MSKLESLLQELCPNGVEIKHLEDVLKIKNGKDYKAFKKGTVPVYGSGGIMTYVDTAVFDKPSVLIPRKGSLDKLYYIEKPFWTVDTIFYTIINTSLVLPKYVFYFLQNRHLEKLNKAGGVPSLTQTILNKVEIPVPPLPVQEEIVRILDQFTQMETELQNKITAEIEARKKQLSFYHNRILDFQEGVKKVQLGEMALVTKLAGYEFTKYVKYSDTGKIIALRGLNVKNGKLDLTNVKYVDESDFSKLERSKLRIGDMLFTYVGTIGQVAVINENARFYLAPNVALIRLKDNKVLPEFMRYYFQSEVFWRTQINRLLQTSSMKNIPMEKIRKFILPVPDIEKQKRIISNFKMLDNQYDTLISNLTAELSARQTQYEYYRDKLLTFKARA